MVSTKVRTTSWSARKSEPFTVSQACSSIESPRSVRSTAAVPPSAQTEWARMSCTLETMPMSTWPSRRLEISTAARRPASPAPRMTTSCFSSRSMKEPRSRLRWAGIPGGCGAAVCHKTPRIIQPDSHRTKSESAPAERADVRRVNRLAVWRFRQRTGERPLARHRGRLERPEHAVLDHHAAQQLQRHHLGVHVARPHARRAARPIPPRSAAPRSAAPRSSPAGTCGAARARRPAPSARVPRAPRRSRPPPRWRRGR